MRIAGLPSKIGVGVELFTKEELYLLHTASLEVLEPKIKELYRDVKAARVVVLGTIEGDIHDIGKSIVALMLEASGFKVYDIGGCPSGYVYREG